MKRISRKQFLKKGVAAGVGLLISGCGQNIPSPTPLKEQQTTTPSIPPTPTTILPTPTTTAGPIYLDPTRPFEERVDDLVGRLSLKEKISQMGSDAPAIERLGIPMCSWWNEALHGVARAGLATVFPQAIGLSSTWNTDLIFRMAQVISDEGRAKHHEAARNGNYGLHTGLTFWSPNINIFRDPRWGRGQETYGEDPFLTSRLAVRYVQGLQGDDPRYLKTVATPKHFAAHSGPEDQRHSFNAIVSQRDLYMTYLPAFKACIVEGQAYSIMGAYNRLNGEACCASPTLLQNILREAWGFEGYVVSDCGAVADIFSGHNLTKSSSEAAALAVKAGCDLECGCTHGILCYYDQLTKAVQRGLVNEDEIDRSVKRLFMARFRLGMFDPPEMVSYSQIPYSIVDSPKHRDLALEVAHQSLVLLKNQDNLLPLDQNAIKKIAVIGPNAAETLVLAGNYSGTPAEPISVLDGIRMVASPKTEVIYARGSEIVGFSEDGFTEAITAAKESQAAVMVMGLSQQLEGEEGQNEGISSGIRSKDDRESLNLPPIQEKLLKAVYETGTPIILVLFNGSAVAINWADEHIPAILEAWYPGQAGGLAVANALFGLFNPGGRLPVTFYRSSSDLPAFDNYSMENRTYRYFSGDTLYPFGFGLSYTTFAYHDLRLSPQQVRPGDSVSIQVDVENTGQRLGDEVVQLYLKDITASLPIPRLQLQGFTRIRLAPGEKQTVQFTLTTEQMSFVDDDGQWVLEPGEFKVWAGGQQPDLKADTQPANVIGSQFTVQV